MASKPHQSTILLRWNEQIPASGVQDPLGLALRGSARLASRLLYCITSITPRARYFSYLPWCIYDYQQREESEPFKAGLRKGIIYREQVLTLGCVAHHDGEPCSGGNLVGSTRASKWLAEGRPEISFRNRTDFAKNPALSAYFNSLVNLGVFETDDEHKKDEEADEEETQHSFEDLRLSPLGLDLAKRLDSRLSGLAATSQIGSKERKCQVRDLRRFGNRAGLCELASTEAPDLPLLRDIFFANVPFAGVGVGRPSSHPVRRRTLLLLLHLCEKLGEKHWNLSEPTFSSIVYYGEVAENTERLVVDVPAPLREIAERWRMFYFHHYMGVALESLFAWLTTALVPYELSGATVGTVLKQCETAAARKDFESYCGFKLARGFSDLCPSDLFATLGIPYDSTGDDLSNRLDRLLRPPHALAEESLESAIKGKGNKDTPLGLMQPLVLLAVSLARFQRWRETRYGRWLANASKGNALNLVPPLVLRDLEKHFENLWHTPFGMMGEYVLRQFIVQQHQTMATVKAKRDNRCLIQQDENSGRLIAEEAFDKIGMGNPRLGSAIQVLTDLGLMSKGDDDTLVLTADGRKWLKAEMAKETSHEVP
jgi:hypothetical protein